MADAAPNTPPAAEEYTAMVPELSAAPGGPPQGEEPPVQDSDFIMATLFGENATPSKKPAGDQGPGAKPAGGAPQESSAPPVVAPAAKGPEATPPVQPVPGAPGSQPVSEPKPAGGPPAQTPAPGEQPAAAEQPPATSGLTPEDRLLLTNATNLASENRQLLEKLRRFESGEQQPPTGQPPSQQPGTAPEQVSLAVPPDLYSAVFSEDEATARNGMNVLVSAVATATMKSVMARVEPLIDSRLKGFDQTLTAQTDAKKQEDDYFKAFPGHSNPLFMPVIQSEIAALQAAVPGAIWNEDFRNALGARVHTKLQLLGFPVGMVPAKEQAAQPGADGAPEERPAVSSAAPMLDPSSRAAAPAGDSDFIAATFA